MPSNLELVSALRKMAAKYADKTNNRAENSEQAFENIQSATGGAVAEIRAGLVTVADELSQTERKLAQTKATRRAGLRRLFDGLTLLHEKNVKKSARKPALVRGKKK